MRDTMQGTKVGRKSVNYASFPFELKAFDPNSGTLEGYASTWDQDEGWDKFQKGAFKKTIQERIPKGLVKLLDSHRWDGSHTIGTVTEAREDDRGLYIKAILASTPDAQMIRQKIMEGHLNRFSIGYIVIRERYEGENETLVRVIEEAKLLEVSVVPLPMNEAAEIVSVKSVPHEDLPLASPATEWDEDAAGARVREWAGGTKDLTEMGWSQYHRAFVWYDSDTPEALASHKLQIGDIVDGNLMAVPSAIFAAAKAVQNAGSELGVPDGAIPHIKRHLERYYERMGLQAPWHEQSLDALVTEIKAGKLASAADFDRLSQAIGLLYSVLSEDEQAKALEMLSPSSAGPEPSKGDPPTVEGKEGKAAEPGSQAARLRSLTAEIEALDLEISLAKERE